MEAQKIIITGGATRIGAAIAEKLSGNNKEIVIQFNKSKLSAEKLKKKLSTQKNLLTEYDQDGNLDWKYIYKYDSNNLMIEEVRYKFTEKFGGQENKTNKTVFEYEYYE